jgi:DNA repair protein RadC
MLFIKEMMTEDKPRERLVQHGVESLSNYELLAILLQTGTKTQSVIDLSKQVLHRFDQLKDIEKVSYPEWVQIPGIGMAKACTVMAAIELTKRVIQNQDVKVTQIVVATDIYHHLKNTLSHLEQEHFYTIYLDMKNQILATKRLYIGTLNQSNIHPREVFKHAVKLSAASVIFVHNHPSGDSTPSLADYRATEQLEQSAKIMGVSVIDHIVMGKKECYSIKENRKYHFE